MDFVLPDDYRTLKFAADGKEHAAREATDNLSQLFQLSDEEKSNYYFVEV